MIGLGIAAAIIFFGSIAFIAAYASRMICADVEPAPDGPRAGKPPVIALVVGAAILGGAIVAAQATPAQIGLSVLVVFAMVACWCSDATCGLLPDVFTLVPLALLAVFAFIQRDWQMALSAAFIFVPFAGMAALHTRARNGLGGCKARDDHGGGARRAAGALSASRRVRLQRPSVIASPGGRRPRLHSRRTSRPRPP